MNSLTHELALRSAVGKKPMVKVGDLRYEFSGVVFGGTSPRVCLAGPLGSERKSAAEWRRLGAKL